jgi:hypothetical protein
MKILVIILFLIFLSPLVYGNETREYIATKQGITIISGGSFDSVKSQELLNEFLDFLLTKIKRKDNQVKIVIQTCILGIAHPKNEKRSEYIFISYDTLLKRDTIYLEESQLTHNQELFDLPATKNWIYNSWFPLFDISKLYSKTDVGLKIKYECYDPSIDFYDRIIGIVSFATENISNIKNVQKNYYFPYFMEMGMNISMLSVDTGLLNNLNKEFYGFDASLKPRNSNYLFISGFLIFTAVIIIFYLVRRKLLLT